MQSAEVAIARLAILVVFILIGRRVGGLRFTSSGGAVSETSNEEGV